MYPRKLYPFLKKMWIEEGFLQIISGAERSDKNIKRRTFMKDKALIENKKQEIIKMTVEFIKKFLNEEYDEVCRRLIDKMSRKRNVPFLHGKIEIWAAAIIYALGQNNFLFDKNTKPYVKPDDICLYFGTTKSTTSQKAKTIRDMFKMWFYDPEFTIPSIAKGNPLNNYIEVDGLILPKSMITKEFSCEDGGELSSIGRAQKVIYEALECPDSIKRGEMALEALKISKNCVDAYVLLAKEFAATPEEALELYEAGLKAGRHFLGENYFEENAGHFWGLVETRPYMRAMEGMASVLWNMGEKYKSINTYLEILRLNPNDNQGIRYNLYNLMLEEDRDEELKKILDRYKCDTDPMWLYTSALWHFRKEGNSFLSMGFLRNAITANSHVPTYLLGKKESPENLPHYMTSGQWDEAVAYAVDAIGVWQKTPGAREWLAKNLPVKV